jgi:hypothetical protein
MPDILTDTNRSRFAWLLAASWRTTACYERYGTPRVQAPAERRVAFFTLSRGVGIQEHRRNVRAERPASRPGART